MMNPDRLRPARPTWVQTVADLIGVAVLTVGGCAVIAVLVAASWRLVDWIAP